MKSVVNTFVSKQQLGFVPKRLIGEATHLLKLIQAYLEETDEEGLILALDWEKKHSIESVGTTGDSLALCMLRDGVGSPLLMARSCVMRASCANASARSANRLRVYLQTLLGSKGNT
eukprot:scaffold19268_cov141-Isochrysis_galbana.AAC.1